jgi:hypothetical protein
MGSFGSAELRATPSLSKVDSCSYCKSRLVRPSRDDLSLGGDVSAVAVGRVAPDSALRLLRFRITRRVVTLDRCEPATRQMHNIRPHP